MNFFHVPSGFVGTEVNKDFNIFCSDKCLKKLVDGTLTCNCGEYYQYYEWAWDNNNNNTDVKMSRKGKHVIFHPTYSSGTAVVKGNKIFQQNCHYYWEIRIMSELYGTDVMIGVGTTGFNFADRRHEFCSLLGIDSNSWGYSYHGYIQHDKLVRQYGSPFGMGSIIGLHLDMCNGTLEYFLNRKSLGVAFKDLKGKELYPMVSSTAANSTINICCCISRNPTLQLLCLGKIVEQRNLYKQYREIPGLTKIYDKQYIWMTPQYVDEKKRLAELDEEVTLSLVNKFDYTKCTNMNIFLEDDDSMSEDLFSSYPLDTHEYYV
ncbi:SPRY domain-containing SOCS box protein 3 isoform X2 [Rhynchophorus ferrugineus]|uniref:SPRY domain-containing SOCS box protein 3 isoform X2 n=1 Tax=Rhynchophorus ferrugineus TaxID=354439 RepID=UPI003FCCF974